MIRKENSSMASPSSSISGLHRRPVNPSSSDPPSAGGPLHPDVDPPPRPPRVLQLLAFVLVIFLACLQFLPATHFRHHADPTRSWIPFDSDPTATTSESKTQSGAEMIHIFSWTDCLNLRALAVLVNSTLSNSRLLEHVYFNFFVPEGEDEKVSYYKLKLLLPHSNLNIIGQKEIKEKLRVALPEWELLWPSLHQLIPLIIPSFIPGLSKFIYVSSDLIVKGNIEDIFGVDLGSHGIAAAEDCTKRLGDYVKIDVLNAIQRTAAKRWVSDKPYDTHACIPDLNVILFEAKYLDKELLEAIPWWIKVLNLKDERNKISPAIALALYNKYVKLPSSWKLGAPEQSKLDSEINILHYDGPLRVCSEDSNQHQGSDIGNIWRQYLPAKSDVILDH